MGPFYYEIQYEEGCDLYEEMETPKGTPESGKKKLKFGGMPKMVMAVLVVWGILWTFTQTSLSW